MADDDQQQEGQQQPQQQPGKVKMLQPRTTVVDDDYQYEVKMPPRRPFDQAAPIGQQSGGMSAQFEIVSSGLNNTA
jgi:hypothetical protein